MLTKENYIQAADAIKVPVAAIMAVSDVEGGGAAFTEIDGKQMPIVCYEPHRMWVELKLRGINPEKYVLGNGDILYKSWKPGNYPRTQKERYALIDRAAKIDRDSALCATSWGKYQILADKWRECGCESLQEFINAMYRSEVDHLLLFCHYIEKTGIAKYLRKNDWASFAKYYNGAGYEKNRYHTKLAEAFQKHSA